jgi:hypothetical protein
MPVTVTSPLALTAFLAIDAKFRCPQRQVVAPGRFGKSRVAQHGHLGIAALKFHGIGVDQVAGKGAFHGTLLFSVMVCRVWAMRLSITSFVCASNKLLMPRSFLPSRSMIRRCKWKSHQP